VDSDHLHTFFGLNFLSNTNQHYIESAIGLKLRDKEVLLARVIIIVFHHIMVKSASSTNVDKTILELVTLETARHKELVMALCELGKEAEGSECTGQI
jgi:hypothetical protein